MGVLIAGDPRGDAGPRYTIHEIFLATGVKESTLRSRRKRLGLRPEAEGYPYDVVVRLLHKPVRGRAHRPELAERLRKQLKNDGYI